jgi:hypothetical protein
MSDEPKYKSPWTIPVIVLGVLIVVVFLGTCLAVVLT